MQLLRVKKCIYSVTISDKLEVVLPINISPNRNYDFQFEPILSNNWLRLFTSGNSLLFSVRITNKYLLFITGNNSFPETIIKQIFEQLLTNFYSQFIRFLSGTFEHQTKLEQMMVHSGLRTSQEQMIIYVCQKLDPLPSFTTDGLSQQCLSTNLVSPCLKLSSQHLAVLSLITSLPSTSHIS